VALGLTSAVYDEHGVGGEREMRDRLSLMLPQVQYDLLAAVRKAAKKVVLVIVSGSAVPFDAAQADAALYAMYGGAQAGSGLADVLFGDVAPAGRLPFTVFDSLAQLKPMEDYDLTTQPGRAHLYYDAVPTHGAPQFWFGYGLSYTTFAYSALRLNSTGCGCSGGGGGGGGRDCGVTATATVTNTGTTAAREVAQLYLSRPAPPAGVPAAAWPLRGFARTAVLAPGASATLAFALLSRDLSHVLADGSRAVSAGSYTVSVGGSGPKDTNAPTKPVLGSITLPSCDA